MPLHRPHITGGGKVGWLTLKQTRDLKLQRHWSEGTSVQGKVYSVK